MPVYALDTSETISYIFIVVYDLGTIWDTFTAFSSFLYIFCRVNLEIGGLITLPPSQQAWTLVLLTETLYIRF